MEKTLLWYFENQRDKMTEKAREAAETTDERSAKELGFFASVEEVNAFFEE